MSLLRAFALRGKSGQTLVTDLTINAANPHERTMFIFRYEPNAWIPEAMHNALLTTKLSNLSLSYLAGEKERAKWKKTRPQIHTFKLWMMVEITAFLTLEEF